MCHWLQLESSADQVNGLKGKTFGVCYLSEVGHSLQHRLKEKQFCLYSEDNPVGSPSTQVVWIQFNLEPHPSKLIPILCKIIQAIER